jgi:hypothetical protein
MESENDLLIDDYEKRTESIFGILLSAGVAGIFFFTMCLFYGIVYLVFSVARLL